MHIKKGDKVKVLTGKEKGKTAVVVRAIPATNQVILEGLNIYKKHRKGKKQGEKGAIIDIARPMHASNVKLADKKEKPVKKEKLVPTEKKAKKVKKSE